MQLYFLLAVAAIAIVYLSILIRRHRNEARLNSLISSISHEIVLLEDAKSIGRKLRKIIERDLEVLHVSILLYDEKKGDFRFLHDEEKHISFSEFNNLFLHLEATDRLLSRQTFKGTDDENQALRLETEKYLNQVEAQLCVPLIFERRLIGVINVGSKKGGQHFSQFDYRVLGSIRRHVSVAFTNSLLFDSMSRLFEEGEDAKEQLKEEERGHKQLVAHLSHELKIPLSLVEGYVTYLQSGRYGHITRKQRAILPMMDKEVRRLGRMAGSLLIYSRMHAETIRPEKDLVALSPLMGECLKELKGEADEKGITMEIQVDEGHIVIADRDQLKEVLLNLLSNAIRFTEKGSVTIRSERVDGHIRVQVEDTGIGIAKDRLGTIFSAHEQRELKVGKRFSGTGIGLAITKRLLEAHGSSISVESELGEGTTFTFSLEAGKER